MESEARQLPPFWRRLSNAAVLATVFLCTMAALSALSYWRAWETELSKTEELCRALSTAAAEQIFGSLRSTDLTIQRVGQYLQDNAGIDPRIIAASLDIQGHTFPEIAALIIANDQGMGRSTSTREVLDYSHHDFFALQRRLFLENKVVLDGPRRDEMTGEWRVYLSRPRVGDDGRFLGVIAAALKPSIFADPLKATGMSDRGMVMLLNVNNVVFGRFPDGDKWIGTTLRSWTLPDTAGEDEQGMLRTHGKIDGVDEIAAYKVVRNYPLLAVAGISVASVRDAWWSGTSHGIAILAAIGLVMVYLALLFDRHERQRRRAALELAQLNQELEARVVERTRSLSSEIAERTRAEARSEKAKEAYRELFDEAIEGILIHRDFKPLLANQSCAQLFGYGSVDQLLALPSVLALVAPESRVQLMRATDEALATGEPTSLEFEGMRPDQGNLWCLNSIRRVDWEGAPAIQAAFVNITATKSWQFEMHEAKEAAERASVLKSRFLAVASHDLRQPAQALAFYVNVLSKRVGDPELAELTRRISESSESLSRLLDSLLDMSRLEAGAVRPDLQSVGLAEMFERLWALYCPAAEQAGVSLSVVASNLHVVSDPTLLERVLQNLIANAIRYTPTGGKVLMGCRRAGDRVRIQVIDTGRGIPEEALTRVFDEFFRLGSAVDGRRVGVGLGLGLSIVRRLCDLMGHRLAVRSWVGRGSIFAVELALAERVAAAPEPSQPATLRAWPPGRRVMVIDNDASLRDSLSYQLEDWGFRVDTAGSIADAVALLRRDGVPDIVLADYRLDDGETGTAAVAALEAEMGRPLAFILLTGETTIAAESDLRLAECRVLHKPIAPEALKQALAEELGAGAPEASRAASVA